MKKLSLIIGSLFLTACAAQAVLPVEEVLLTAPNGEKISIAAEIADDDEERATGLMLREKLPEGTGMLFVFDSSEVRSFWMKNTLIPLDVLFFNENGVFVSSSTMEPCTADPCQAYLSALPAKFALEVPAGFTQAEGVTIGWKLEYSID